MTVAIHSSNIRQSLEAFAPIDMNCTHFGFFRIPKLEHIIYFSNQPANTEMLLNWSKAYENTKKVVPLNTNSCYFDSQFNYTMTAWYQTLINTDNIESGYQGGSRNNTLLTLALANYASQKTYQQAYDELDQFNSNLKNPLSKKEFDRTLKSAYSGKYHGPKKSYVEYLLELWSNKNVNFTGPRGWYKFKKPREERIRSHYDEWENDIVQYIEKNTSPENPYIEGSLRMLAETIGMAFSTLKEVLKRSNLLIKGNA